MKALVFFLVLANVLFYAFSEGYLGRADNPDATRVQMQVKADRMRIVSRGETPAAAPLPPALVVEPRPEPKPELDAKKDTAVVEGEKSLGTTLEKTVEKMQEAVEAKPVADAAPSSATETKVCLLWEHLSITDAERVGGLVANKFTDYKIRSQNADGEARSWWVFIPPQQGKQGADKKAGELRGLGVTDYFTVPDGPNRFAISLGIYSGEKGAQERLSELKKQGVRSARLIPRPDKDGMVNIEASGPVKTKDALLKAVGKPEAKELDANCQ